jgi:alpha-D-xyloside xylohydrolase
MVLLLSLLSLHVLHASCFSSASPPVVQLDAWGDDSVRIRIAPPSGSITDPPYTPLLIPHPSHSAGGGAVDSSPVRLASGNLLVTADAVTGFVTASRVSDGAPLFTTTSLVFGQPANGSRAGSVSASITLAISGGADNVVLGLGEHRTGKLDATGYSKTLAESQYYTKSHGADIMIPFYSVHPLGLGLLWALPSYGAVSLSATEGHTWSSLATLNIDLWITTTPTPATLAQRQLEAEGNDPAASSPLAALLSNFVDAVGHAAPMPSYVAGFWACKNRYRNQSQLLDVARGYKSRGLPLDIITVVRVCLCLCVSACMRPFPSRFFFVSLALTLSPPLPSPPHPSIPPTLRG